MDRPKKSAVNVVFLAPRKRGVKPEAKWRVTFKICPNCKEAKAVDPDFGVVVRRGIQNAAGWCKACRKSTNYHTRPRKNRTRNFNPDTDADDRR